jgi:hypothetical protein
MLNQYEYGAGDAIEYENLATNYDSCYWQILNSDFDVLESYEGSHPTIVTGILLSNSSYILRQCLVNKKDEITYTEKSFLIKSDRQKLVINMQSGAQGEQDDYVVYVDNQYIGDSGYQGIFNKKIPLGWRIVKLVAANETYEALHEFDGQSLSVNIEF